MSRLARPAAAGCLAALALAAAAPAQEAAPREGYRALAELEPAEGVRPPRARLGSLAGRVASRLPGLEKLDVPTTGTLRLAVILVEFPDAPRPEHADPAGWEEALFSEGTYAETPTGEPAAGSLRDFYLENSGGRLAVEGRVFAWVPARAPRAELERQPMVLPGAQRDLLGAGLDGARAQAGPGGLDAFDALVFVVSGGWAARRGSILWPHSSLVRHRGQVWRYYLMHAGVERFEPIGVHTHELGHVLGILDKYGLGSGTGLGQWCNMANGAHGGRDSGVDLEAPTEDPGETVRRILREQVETGLDWLEDALRGRRAPRPSRQSRPLHFCAVCKARLGWSDPVGVDPREGPVRFYLTPIEDDAGQVARILLDPRGRESLYLEHRAPTGFDADLPRGGLLVWRVGSPGAALRTFVPFEGVELIPAHGQRSTDAARRDPSAVPFPTADADGVVVRGLRRGAWDVALRGVEVADGRCYVEVARADR